MGLLAALQRLDEKVAGRGARRLGPPRGATALRIWADLTAEEREHLRVLALVGGVHGAPAKALVVAELVDQVAENLDRMRPWMWLGHALTVVLFCVLAIVVDTNLLAFVIIPLLSFSFGVNANAARLARVRRRNLDVAASAGLL